MHKKILTLAILTLCCAHSVTAGIFDHCNLFGKKKTRPSRPIVSPYTHPTYGYYATQWRRFPGAYYPNDLQDLGPVHNGVGGSTGFGGNTGLDETGFGTPQLPTYESPTTAPASEYVRPSMDSIQNLPPQTTPPPTPPSASRMNTDALRGVREALVPATPKALQVPRNSTPAQQAVPQPPPAPFPPLKRTTYSIRVAPAWGSGSRPTLPEVRPMPTRDK
ncbi:MAG: hypothetical protein AB8G99_19285 [Planctomycetaceae bacterium]